MCILFDNDLKFRENNVATNSNGLDMSQYILCDVATQCGINYLIYSLLLLVVRITLIITFVMMAYRTDEYKELIYVNPLT